MAPFKGFRVLAWIFAPVALLRASWFGPYGQYLVGAYFGGLIVWGIVCLQGSRQSPTVRTIEHLDLLLGRSEDKARNRFYCPSCRSLPGGPFPLDVPVKPGLRAKVFTPGVVCVETIDLICQNPAHNPPARFTRDRAQVFAALRDMALTAELPQG